ncbi:pilus assembly protein [Pararhizobium sp. YC-54]|uniref:pilus assembly protein n=1 Tax=Pararhizobium sp. YC-54 TaxID=2986920 RepID=UPI0035575783
MLQRNKRVVLILAVASLASGCADYLNHRDTITFGAGNAVEANKGIHIQDPFPQVAQYTRITSDGKVIYKVIRNHQGGQTAAAAPTMVMPVVTTNGASGTPGYAQ